MSESNERPTSESGAKLFKVAFDLEEERPNWPPVSIERLWGEKTAVKLEIRVVNTPFFVRGISFGDLIRVRPDNERRELVFESFTSESGHSTVRIVLLRDTEREIVELKLRSAGCSWELAHSFGNLLAIDIPPTVEYGELREWLLAQVEAGVIEIQESAISSIHQQQLPSFP
ncbi:DUF4265 domain-containing protein [Kitasatospora sp. NPDC048239]|uniref:DUF4265 domain-containing protein n=1 Tax=Streptomycetaceae TaxID=2062 RepID=UPI002E770BB8|nr:DUF4265 domain-containing protein [Streptomyces sp. SP17BM10]MEE1782760.1 DUF4265 domain-containing protein [Streptomyces sp. SP17BM10]